MAWQAYAVIAGMQIMNGVNQSDVILKQAKLNKEIAELNKQELRIDLFETLRDGQTEISRYDQVISTLEGSQDLFFAQNDIDSDFGTAAQIKSTSGLNGFLNRLDIQNAAQARAMGIERKISQVDLQSTMNYSGSQVQAAGQIAQGVMGAAKTGVSGYADEMSYRNRTPVTQNTTKVPFMTSRNSYLTGDGGDGDNLGYLGLQGGGY